MRIEEVREWLSKTISTLESPPAYRFEPPRASEDLDANVFPNLGLRPSRRKLSGTLEIRIAPTEILRIQDPLSSILKIAHREDPSRKVLPLLPPFEDSQVLVANTRIDSLPVIGPGGKVLVQWSERTLAADITVRRRQQDPIPSENWVAFDVVYRSLLREFYGYEDLIDIDPVLGYFERSKFHLQTFLQPTFLFVVRPLNLGTAESHSVWETTHIITATSNRAVEGSENWEISE